MVESTKFSFRQCDSSPPMVTAIPMNVENKSYSSGVTTPKEENPNEEKVNSDDLKYGAGIAGGIIGLLLGGPILAAIAGFGAAHYTQKDGIAGDAARAVGEVALSAKEKAQEVNGKHQIMDEGKKVADEAWEKAKEMDRQHGIGEKIKEFAIASLKFAISGMELITKKIEDSMEESSSDNRRRS